MTQATHKAKRNYAGNYTYRGFIIDREINYCMQCGEAHPDSDCDDPMLKTVWHVCDKYLDILDTYDKLKDCKESIDLHLDGKVKTMNKNSKLTEQQMIEIIESKSINQQTEEVKKQVFNFAFGEDFIKDK